MQTRERRLNVASHTHNIYPHTDHWQVLIARKRLILAPAGLTRRAVQAHTAGTRQRRVDLPDKTLPSRRYTERRGAQPGVKRSDNSVGLRTLVHDFVQRRPPYSGFCGSCVRMFAISYVE